VSDTREVMDVKQAAEYLGVHVNTVEKLLRSGQLPAFRIGNLWRMKKSAIDKWAEDGGTK
jgi:excisionase family DNA binding protein